MDSDRTIKPVNRRLIHSTLVNVSEAGKIEQAIAPLPQRSLQKRTRAKRVKEPTRVSSTASSSSSSVLRIHALAQRSRQPSTNLCINTKASTAALKSAASARVGHIGADKQSREYAQAETRPPSSPATEPVPDSDFEHLHVRG